MTLETHNANPVETTKPRRSLRFRLRTFLVMVTALSVILGWVGWELAQRRRENVVIAQVKEMGGGVNFYSDFIKPSLGSDERSWWGKKKDNWFGEISLRSLTKFSCETENSVRIKRRRNRFYKQGPEMPNARSRNSRYRALTGVSFLSEEKKQAPRSAVYLGTAMAMSLPSGYVAYS